MNKKKRRINQQLYNDCHSYFMSRKFIQRKSIHLPLKPNWSRVKKITKNELPPFKLIYYPIISFVKLQASLVAQPLLETKLPIQMHITLIYKPKGNTSFGHEK